MKISQKAVIGIAIFSIVLGIGYYFYYRQTAQYYINNSNQLVKEALSGNQETFEKNFNLAFENLNMAEAKYPERLDIKLGKMYLCFLIKNSECLKENAIRTIVLSKFNNNQWQWNKGETRDNLFMLETIQFYQKKLFEAEQDATVYQIANTILGIYPDHVPSLNSIAIVFMANGKLDKADEFLQKAHALAPNDDIVNKNILELEKHRKEKPSTPLHEK